MIDVNAPDYTNTPASDQRPLFYYQASDCITPFVSIITPYYNTGPVFQETVRSIQRMSFTHWEWLIVDDGSTTTESLTQLELLAEEEPRVRVIHQANGGPAVARNRAVKEASGRYLLQLDSDDMVEPTFVEKALWVLETQPQFAACNSRNVTFGSKNALWPHGFEKYKNCLLENWVTNQAVIRRQAFLEAGGYDERISQGHEDWDLWLNLAEAGHWGYTLPEYLTWYRYHERSRRSETEADNNRSRAFHKWLQQKHRGLASRFPHPQRESRMDIPHARITDVIPVKNPLQKPEGMKRVLFIVPWLEMGSVDKFNPDLIQLLSRRGYEFTIVSTEQAEDHWKGLFTSITPDVFCLHHFLNRGDYPRFLNYLIDTRQIDTVLVDGMEYAFQRTRQFAESRPAEKPDLELARSIAYLAVEYIRIAELTEMPGVQREAFIAGDHAQSRHPLKRRLLPFGSRRYETYKQFRRIVGRAIPYVRINEGS
ncbi:MAG TPA: glycosyltransferase family A protein [Ktedonobacteraceae bacterium]